MALMVLDQDVEKQLKAEREASGADRFDEVWEGIYMMAPLANNEHQDLQFELARAIRNAIGSNTAVRVHTGANVSDRERDWKSNYRIPDVVVVYPGGAARDFGTHWCGGPDFCIEIASPGDRSRDKLDFYADIGVRELLLVGREPWSVELYRLTGRSLELAGESVVATPDTLTSTVVPVSFKLVPGTLRPQIEVTHHDGVQRWVV